MGLISRVSSRTYRFIQNGQENQRTEKAHAAAEARQQESQGRQPPLREEVQELRHRPGHPAQEGPLQVRQVPPSINQFSNTLDKQTVTQLFKLGAKYAPVALA